MFTFVRVIGLPSEEEWPADSPISYSIQWGQKGPETKLLHNLEPDENHLLSVSESAFLALTSTANKISTTFLHVNYFLPSAISGLLAFRTDLCCQGASSSVLHRAFERLVTGGITVRSASSL